MSQRYVLRIPGTKQALEFSVGADGEFILPKNKPAGLKILRREANGLLTVLWGEKIVHGVVACTGERSDVLQMNQAEHALRLNLRTAAVDAMEQGLAAAKSGSSTLQITSPIPGLVKAVQVKKGETVAAGQNLIVLEAMKMENEIVAPHAGVIANIDVKPGEAVAAGAQLLTLMERTE